ncbi:MAG: 3-hydroxyacyl-ACP dehydratase FabZ [Pseudomonadota bacterium]
MDIEAIKRKLPHRYPFLLIDRVIKRSPGNCQVLKNVTVNEPFFNGHFPEQSIMPGALITEAMAQATAFVGLEDEGEETVMKKGFVTMTQIKLQRPVIPGDQLVISAVRVKRFMDQIKFKCSASVDGELVASGDINVAVIE